LLHDPLPPARRALAAWTAAGYAGIVGKDATIPYPPAAFDDAMARSLLNPRLLGVLVPLITESETATRTAAHRAAVRQVEAAAEAARRSFIDGERERGMECLRSIDNLRYRSHGNRRSFHRGGRGWRGGRGAFGRNDRERKFGFRHHLGDGGRRDGFRGYHDDRALAKGGIKLAAPLPPPMRAEELIFDLASFVARGLKRAAWLQGAPSVMATIVTVVSRYLPSCAEHFFSGMAGFRAR